MLHSPCSKSYSLSSFEASKLDSPISAIMLSTHTLISILVIQSGHSMLKAAAMTLPSHTLLTISPESRNETATLPNSLPYTGTNPYCSDSVVWTGLNTLDDQFLQDCREATDKFEAIVATSPKPSTRYEFLAAHTLPILMLPNMETPRRYVSRAC